MTPEMEADMKTLRADFSRLQADVAKLTNTLQHLASNGRRAGADHLGGLVDEIEAGLKDKFEDVSRQIHDKPAASAGLAFGIGLLFGLLFSGRRA